MSDTEQLIYILDLQVPGIEEKTQQVAKMRSELDQLPRAHKEAGGAAKEHGEALKLTKEVTASWREQLQELAGVSLPGVTNAIGPVTNALGGMATGSIAAAAGFIAIGAAVAIAAASLTAVGAEWQHTVTNLAVGTGQTVEQAHALVAGFQQLAASGEAAGFTAQELTEAYTNVGARLELYSGEALNAAQANEIMHVAAEGARAGNQSLESATNALTQQIMASKTPIEESGRVMDVLFNTSKLTGLSYDTLSMIMGRFQARMGEAAPSIEGVAFALAVLNEAGITGQRAMMPVMTMMQELTEPTQKAADVMHAYGIEVKKADDGSLDLPATLESIKTATEGILDPTERHAVLTELVGKNSGILESVLKLTTEQMDKAREATEKEGTASAGAELHSHDLEEKMKTLGAAVLIAAQNFGENLAEALVKDAELMDKVGTAVDRMRTQIQNAYAHYWDDRRIPAQPGVDNSGSDADRARGGAPLPSDAERMRGLGRSAAEAALVGGEVSREQLTAALGAGTNQGETQEQANVRIAIENTRQYQAAQDALRASMAAAAAEEEAAASSPTSIFNPGAIRESAAAMAELGASGEHLHTIMEANAKAGILIPDLQKGVEELNTVVAHEADAWEKSGTVALPMIAALRAATADYTQAASVQNKDAMADAQRRIESIERQVTADEAAGASAKRNAEETKRAVAEAERIAREARQADVGTGLAESAAKGLASADVKADLTAGAARLMDDFYAAMAAQGTQSAAAAGKTLGDAIVAMGAEMRKAGATDWAEQMAAMFDVADAIRRGEPGAVDAFHSLLVHAGEEIESAAVWDKWEKSALKAQDEVAKAFDQYTKANVEADRRSTEQIAAIDEREREQDHDAQARQTEETTLETERRASEVSRIKERWAMEDSDRAEQRQRDERDRADAFTRQLGDLQAHAATSRVDADRQHQQRVADAEAQHQDNLAKIRSAGGPNVATATASENARFEEQKRQMDRSAADEAANRQAREQEQMADLQRRQAQERAAAELKAKEQDADLVKTRARQMAELQKQSTDADALKAHKQELEVQLDISKEQLAARAHATALRRIDEEDRHARETATARYNESLATTQQGLDREFEQIQKEHPLLNLEQPETVVPEMLPEPATQGAQPRDLYQGLGGTGYRAAAPAAAAGGATAAGAAAGGTTGSAAPNLTVNINLSDSVIANEAAMRELSQRLGQEFLVQTRGMLAAGRSPA